MVGTEDRLYSETEAEEIIRKNPKVRECNSAPFLGDELCICGHKEKYHHNHEDWAWGNYSICRLCIQCSWTKDNPDDTHYAKDSCSGFHMPNKICPKCKKETLRYEEKNMRWECTSWLECGYKEYHNKNKSEKNE